MCTRIAPVWSIESLRTGVYLGDLGGCTVPIARDLSVCPVLGGDRRNPAPQSIVQTAVATPYQLMR
jgi:hypothetical protein